jgi:glutathione S-transferase
MKLYADPVSTTCRPILMFLHDHPLAVEVVNVSLFAGEHQAEAFAAINPNRAVPALVDGDFVLTESSAILKYLAELAGGAYPAEPKARARTNQWMDWFNTGLYRDLGYNFVYAQVLPHYRFDNPATQGDVVARGAERAAKWLAILDQHGLAAQTFLGGDAPSIADYVGASYVSLGDWIGMDFSPYPNVNRWLADFRARPCWTETHAAFDGLVAQIRSQMAEAA